MSLHRDDIRAKLDAGEPLTFGNGMRLFESTDIHTLGELANTVRERLHGRRAYYNVNIHINYTNYCVLRCKFCSFYRPYHKDDRSRAAGFSPREHPRAAACSVRSLWRTPGAECPPRGVDATRPREHPRAAGFSPREHPRVAGQGLLPHGHGTELHGGPYRDRKGAADIHGGYELGIDEIVARAGQAYSRGATEVHIVGGLHPKLPFSYYTDMCSAIREACPHMHIKAFTAIEIIHFTRISKPRLGVAEVLTRLREAGLDSLPGGGAEIFDDRVHDEAFKAKVGEAEWFEVHQTAHELGIFTNATMLYGHVETPAERIKHLIKLREHQEESLRLRKAHFNCVVPLSFIPDGSALSHLPGPSGLDDLKTLALSRLMCANIPHIKAFWVMQTPKLAQVSLNWGVDDIDGTVVYYDIVPPKQGGTTGGLSARPTATARATGFKPVPDTTHQELTVDKLKRLIVEAGCQPVERDTLYRPVIRDQNTWRVEGHPWTVTYDPMTISAPGK